jgi:hypothetical protein
MGLGRNAHGYVEQHHRPNTWVKQLSEIYQQVIRLEN